MPILFAEVILSGLKPFSIQISDLFVVISTPFKSFVMENALHNLDGPLVFKLLSRGSRALIKTAAAVFSFQ